MVSAAYDDLRLPALPGLDKELAVLTAWLCSEELSPDRHFTPAHTDLARNPTSGEVRTLMSADHEWSPDDAGVVFVTGHGVRKHGRHWLAFRDTRLDNVFGTAVETAQFVGAMATRSYDNLLVIVDACYSGATGEATIAFDTPIPEHCLVLASAGANQPAYVGTLTESSARSWQSYGPTRLARLVTSHTCVRTISSPKSTNDSRRMASIWFRWGIGC
ncbi:hypothetical protein ACFQX7_27555 [Luedemannella flava]